MRADKVRNQYEETILGKVGESLALGCGCLVFGLLFVLVVASLLGLGFWEILTGIFS